MNSFLHKALIVAAAILLPMAATAQKKVRVADNPAPSTPAASSPQVTFAEGAQTIATILLPSRNGIGPVEYNLVLVKKGRFKMGATEEQKSEAKKDEKGPFLVEFDADYFIGETEVTQQLWKYVMGNNPSANQGSSAQLPVDNVSWEEALQFCNILSGMTGQKFGLPTEAEWEYAARGGHCSAKPNLYSGGPSPDELAWNERNSGGSTHPVKQLAPNALGLYDMSGNVWEMVEDSKSEYPTGNECQKRPRPAECFDNDPSKEKVKRGGAFNSKNSELRVAARGELPYDKKLKNHAGESNTGLRIVMKVPQ